MRHRDQGFTLVEVIVAMTIFVIAITLIVPAFTSFLSVNSSNEQQTQAVRAAQQVLDRVRLQDPTSLPITGSSPVQSVTVGGHPYQVVVVYCYTPAYCGSGSRDLEVEVSDNGKLLFSAETAYTQVSQ
jgi:prepilin-type N-terminal cleavage/methylation domain-containing protein